jgi:hypothetical protein
MCCFGSDDHQHIHAHPGRLEHPWEDNLWDDYPISPGHRSDLKAFPDSRRDGHDIPTAYYGEPSHHGGPSYCGGPGDHGGPICYDQPRLHDPLIYPGGPSHHGKPSHHGGPNHRGGPSHRAPEPRRESSKPSVPRRVSSQHKPSRKSKSFSQQPGKIYNLPTRPAASHARDGESLRRQRNGDSVDATMLLFGSRDL